MQETLLINGTKASKYLGVAANKMKTLRDQQGLPHVVIDRRHLYPMDGLRRWVEKKTKTKETTAA